MDLSIKNSIESAAEDLSNLSSFTTRKDFEIMRGTRTPKLDDFSIPADVWIKENLPWLMSFVDFCSKLENALGVAANQVSFRGKRVSSRFFVYRSKKDMSCPMEAVIDPRIEETYGDPVDEAEGCLSWPNKTVLARRYLKIKVSYTTIHGERITDKILDRYQSQVWQHEMDHLDGIEEKFITTSHPFKRETEKIGRNDVCPCGSGKKFKKCCGA
jgi:peptide deformylase